MPILPRRLVAALALALSAMPLQAQTPTATTPPRDPTFAEDAAFLAKHKETIILSSPDGQAKVAVVPGFQGRVMTSTNRGDSGPSFGFINRELIASGKLVPKNYAFGGEDRFWMGPEGGQFAIFFPPGPLEGPYTLDTWQTPACIDSDAYEVDKQTANLVSFTHTATFLNRSGNEFKVRIGRVVHIIEGPSISGLLGIAPPSGCSVVDIETVNTIANIGPTAWDENTGLLSIWNLGMFPPSPQVTVVSPFLGGPDAPPGEAVNTSYFGQVPSNRVRVDSNTGHVYFRGDALLRTKIGIAHTHAVWSARGTGAMRRSYPRSLHAPSERGARSATYVLRSVIVNDNANDDDRQQQQQQQLLHKRLFEGIQKYQDAVLNQNLLFTYWSIWAPAQTVNFMLVPPHLRVFFVAMVSFFWVFMLSVISSDDAAATHEKNADEKVPKSIREIHWGRNKMTDGHPI